MAGIGAEDNIHPSLKALMEKRNAAGSLIAKLLSQLNTKTQVVDLQSCLQVFHKFYGQDWETTPKHMSIETAQLRKKLVDEEVNAEFIVHINEYIKHISHPHFNNSIHPMADQLFVSLVDDCVDILFVVVGTLVSMGVDLAPVFAEVMLSNMSKAGEDGQPIIREDGKVLKGPNYFQPDLASVVGKIKK